MLCGTQLLLSIVLSCCKVKKNNSKNVIVSDVSDWVINTISDSLSKVQIEKCKDELESKKGDLYSILSSNKKVQNSKEGKGKDPYAPKRGKSSYILFCIENRCIIKNKNPEMSAKDIIKELGKSWKDLDENTKQRYIKSNRRRKETVHFFSRKG